MVRRKKNPSRKCIEEEKMRQKKGDGMELGMVEKGMAGGGRKGSGGIGGWELRSRDQYTSFPARLAGLAG